MPAPGKIVYRALRKVVEDNHFAGLVERQTMNQMAANETSTTGNKNSHIEEKASSLSNWRL